MVTVRLQYLCIRIIKIQDDLAHVREKIVTAVAEVLFKASGWLLAASKVCACSLIISMHIYTKRKTCVIYCLCCAGSCPARHRASARRLEAGAMGSSSQAVLACVICASTCLGSPFGWRSSHTLRSSALFSQEPACSTCAPIDLLFGLACLQNISANLRFF